MFGLAALKPAKNPTPNRTIRSIDKNLLYEYFISFIPSFKSAVFILTSFTLTYHSISEIGVGFGFVVMLNAVPFLKCITLSAIGVNALL